MPRNLSETKPNITSLSGIRSKARFADQPARVGWLLIWCSGIDDAKKQQPEHEAELLVR
jgi:hypothetical protein